MYNQVVSAQLYIEIICHLIHVLMNKQYSSVFQVVIVICKNHMDVKMKRLAKALVHNHATESTLEEGMNS